MDSPGVPKVGGGASLRAFMSIGAITSNLKAVTDQQAQGQSISLREVQTDRRLRRRERRNESVALYDCGGKEAVRITGKLECIWILAI